MNKLDFQHINDQLNAELLVPQWLPHGKRSGANWSSSNPTRTDKTPGSFSVNLRTGRWADFAYDESDKRHRGGDLVGLYAYLFHNGDQGAAARELMRDHGIVVNAATREKIANQPPPKVSELPQYAPIFPVPAGVPAPDFKHWEHGLPTAKWEYKDADGNLLLYVCRFDPPNEKKQTWPLTWGYDPKNKRERWHWKGIAGKAKRPLYGLDRLAELPNGDVVMGEGEKTADAIQDMMGPLGAVGVTWMGGVETAVTGRVSLKPLAGRRVILVPDFDRQKYKENHPVAELRGQIMPPHEQPGMKAMLAHAQALKGVAREVLLVGYDHGENWPEGWDLADAKRDGWDGQRVLRFIAERSGDPVTVAAGKWRKLELPAVPAAPAGGGDDDLDDQDEQEQTLTPLNASVNPFGFPDKSDKEQPANTVENLEYLISCYGIKSKYNQVRKQVELTLPGRSYTLDNQANCSLAELTSICARNRMPKTDLADYVKLLADRNSYNPVADWITSKPWDGTSRLDKLFATVTADSSMDAKLKNQLIYRWMLSAVAAIFKSRGFTSHGCLVFTGKQGIGKTTWVKRLVPDELGVVLEGAALDPDNKDDQINVVSHWLVELGELDGTFRKSDIARLKQFITKAVDKLRRPYDRIESEYQRRTVFFASVNTAQYLVDDTENRRWWTIPAEKIDYRHALDMQQIWAEFYEHYKRGEQWWLMPEEQAALNSLNEEHQVVDPVREKILRAFDWEGTGLGGERMTASEVLHVIGIENPNQAQATKASQVLKELTGQEPKRTNKARLFDMPKRVYGNRRRSDPNDDEIPFPNER